MAGQIFLFAGTAFGPQISLSFQTWQTTGIPAKIDMSTTAGRMF